jgi:carbamoyl-phosphate synthase small subunit
MALPPIPSEATACLLLVDGTVFFGETVGSSGFSVGEICFNTAMTGYQEVLTDPSYAGQIITFTFPHIGNVGANRDDIEAAKIVASGLVLREPITPPASFRSEGDFNEWLIKHRITGICRVDTRALTRHIRKAGAQNAMIIAGREQLTEANIAASLEKLRGYPSMKGMELAKTVSCSAPYEWTDTLWQLPPATKTTNSKTFHVVAVDYGVKINILRCLAERGLRLTVVPAGTSAAAILAYKPDGVFLSNGPGDPAATGAYALPIIKELMESGLPIFGICLGHQLLGLAMGGKTEKMAQGHRGANHPVKDLRSGQVIITSQNHGFAVSKDGLPDDVEITHLSLFDGTIQGLRHKTKPIFCMQGHPEASPGPHDSQYLFDQFAEMMKNHA